MTIGQYITASGIAGPEAIDTLNLFDSFITAAVGWQKIDGWDDSATDQSRVWYSEGETPGKYAPIYLRIRANVNYLEFRGYTTWDPDTSTGSDVIENSTELRIHNQTGADTYAFFGNKDVVYMSVRLDNNTYSYTGGCGYWDTYYTPEQDPYPLFVMGMNGNTDTFANTARIRSYAHDKNGYLHTASTYSGTDAVYVAQDRNFLTVVASPNKRDNRHVMLKQDFYTQRSRTDGGMPGMLAHEVRGELPGFYQFHGLDFVSYERVVASGISIGDNIAGSEVGVGDWIVCRATNANTYAIGPTVDWDVVPNTIPNIELWLHGGGVWTTVSGGSIRALLDLSTNINYASQATGGLQPEQRTPAAYNSKPVVELDSTAYMTGSLTYVEGCTAFVVADYTPGTASRPLLHVRGDVSSDDTILSLGFNATVSGSAEVVARTDGAPLNEDIERYTGLKSQTPYILSTVVSGTTTSLYVNGDSTGSTTIVNTKGAVTGSTELTYAIGASLNSGGGVGSGRHSGNIAEVIVYTRHLTQEEHQSVVCYLGARYGITVSGTCV